jgi:hypothetical protein
MVEVNPGDPGGRAVIEVRYAISTGDPTRT